MDAASLCLGKSRTNFKFYFVILRTQIPKKTQRAAEHHLADGERSQRERGGSILVVFFSCHFSHQRGSGPRYFLTKLQIPSWTPLLSMPSISTRTLDFSDEDPGGHLQRSLSSQAIKLNKQSSLPVSWSLLYSGSYAKHFQVYLLQSTQL